MSSFTLCWFAQIHWTLFYHHAAVLLLPGLFWGRSFLPGPHWHCCWEASYPRRPWNLVVCGLDPAHHWQPNAQRLQQLVYLLLSSTAECDWELCPILCRYYLLNIENSRELATTCLWYWVCELACSKRIWISAVQSEVQGCPRIATELPNEDNFDILF